MNEDQPSTSSMSIESPIKVESQSYVKGATSIKLEKVSPNDKKRVCVDSTKKTVTSTPPEKKMKTSPGSSKVKEVIEMTIGDKKVKVQKISVSKSEADAMAKAGRIQMKDGAMILSKGKAKGK